MSKIEDILRTAEAFGKLSPETTRDCLQQIKDLKQRIKELEKYEFRYKKSRKSFKESFKEWFGEKE